MQLLSREWIETHLVQNSLQRLRIIRHTISYSTVVPHTRKVADVVVLILRVTSADNVTLGVQQGRGFIRWGYAALSVDPMRVTTFVDVSLRPCINSLRIPPR